MKLAAVIVFLVLMVVGGLYSAVRANREPAVDELRFVQARALSRPADQPVPIIIPSPLPPRSPYKPLGAGLAPDIQEWPQH